MVEDSRNRDNDNAQRLDPLTTAGNYNEVLVTSASTPVDNPSEWPPQLSGLGVVPQEDTLLHQVLPVADYVVRMTRRDPFEGDPKVFRSLNKDAMITEMASPACRRRHRPPILQRMAVEILMSPAPQVCDMVTLGATARCTIGPTS